MTAATEARRPAWQRAVITMALVIAGLVVIEIIDLAMNGRLDQNGIVPRRLSGVDGILWAPLLHADFSHLAANVVPGAVLGFFLLLARRFGAVTTIVWLVSGLGVWLTGPSGTVTVGASGVVFGWLAYLLVRGVFNRDPWQGLGGLAILAVYGGVLWGVLPQGGGASWQGHLFGAVGGVLAAWMLSDRRGEGDRRGEVPAGER
ncbi:rhomboid family intramembrane serine protease [Gordonia shandongensis]|uniref:rhomboid family intramembrane serine protease n=1 Tax=Gordonia shandongensis TaxID=376351 RepID=UPI0003FB7632|nr:rhomboid family intramembrane serine protease [Gordonia shandongensis]